METDTSTTSHKSSDAPGSFNLKAHHPVLPALSAFVESFSLLPMSRNLVHAVKEQHRVSKLHIKAATQSSGPAAIREPL